MVKITAEGLTVNIGTLVKAVLIVITFVGTLYWQLLPIRENLATINGTLTDLKAKVVELEALHPRQP